MPEAHVYLFDEFPVFPVEAARPPVRETRSRRGTA